ncbi:hypothetical protein A3726_10210 [Erythrobacter sp. HI0037]|nr:hypothetical protein A3719_01595 [Erythrobacter sp. HI0020]KZY12275.1 hypothetical protein A3727_22095 [Erythrobacter sp. HI0038]KZY17013.1 hypothetical protein A3726_10210 [Erythrobacter sp. HI0037]KZY21504.1 hypothetical protein A3727_13090 [Erythrobacter sp. HI0038]
MSFAKLYEFANALGEYPVRLQGIVDEQVKAFTAQDELYYVPCELDPDISLGHIKQYRVPAVVYDGDPAWVTEIRYHNELNTCWKRYVCCKELMHCFDFDEERVDEAEKFEQLLDEIEAPLPNDASSPMYKSEVRTLWMAVAILCPQTLRDHFKQQLDAKELSPYEVALNLRIPEALVRTIMGESYDKMIPFLLEKMG